MKKVDVEIFFDPDAPREVVFRGFNIARVPDKKRIKSFQPSMN